MITYVSILLTINKIKIKRNTVFVNIYTILKLVSNNFVTEICFIRFKYIEIYCKQVILLNTTVKLLNLI